MEQAVNKEFIQMFSFQILHRMSSTAAIRGSKLCSSLSHLQLSVRGAAAAAEAQGAAAWGLRAEKVKTFAIYR
jgi:hypothetical protein